MLYCKNCNKEVVIFGLNYDAISEKNLNNICKKLEKDGKLILFNPPPFGPYYCPRCSQKLKEK